MTSSALTGNTSGLASATSPGLVGITTQTFAGDKTLTGLVTASGGIINTGLTGANATAVITSGSLKVGEIRNSSIPNFLQATPTLGTAYNVTSGALSSVSPGIYLITLSGTMSAVFTGLLQNELCQIVVSSGSATYIAGGSATNLSAANTSSSGFNAPVTLITFWNVTATATFQAQIASTAFISGSPGTPSSISLNSSNISSLRVA
jgi:hypothetical protein